MEARVAPIPCRLGHHKHAATLKKTFGISDKRFYWLKVCACVWGVYSREILVNGQGGELSSVVRCCPDVRRSQVAPCPFGQIPLPQVLTLSEEHNWEELDMFASERKSPIGWEPFLELAKKSGAPREVQSR